MAEGIKLYTKRTERYLKYSRSMDKLAMFKSAAPMK